MEPLVLKQERLSSFLTIIQKPTAVKHETFMLSGWLVSWLIGWLVY